MAKLTATEKETVILFNEKEDTVEVYTYNGKIKRLAAPHLYRLIRDGGDGGVTYRLPKFLFSARFRVPLSEEKRRELSNRARRVKPHLSHAKPQAFDKDTTGVES